MTLADRVTGNRRRAHGLERLWRVGHLVRPDVTAGCAADLARELC
ncbi:MAG: hypothetical protein ACO3TS_05390 [Candidatus Nanopelagicales bacterium]